MFSLEDLKDLQNTLPQFQKMEKYITTIKPYFAPDYLDEEKPFLEDLINSIQTTLHEFL